MNDSETTYDHLIREHHVPPDWLSAPGRHVNADSLHSLLHDLPTYGVNVSSIDPDANWAEDWLVYRATKQLSPLSDEAVGAVLLFQQWLKAQMYGTAD